MIPSEVEIITHGDKVRFKFEGISTGWMDRSDSFVERIDEDRLKQDLFERHLLKELQIRNILDEGIGFLNDGNFKRAIECFDEVLFYDEAYGEALINKSRALCAQRHFIKSLRFYKCAINASGNLVDDEYHELLLYRSGEERDSLPQFKRNIYEGDVCFESGDFKKALESYKKALANPSKGKEKILFKLLNKIASTCVALNDFETALDYFNQSLSQLNNDYACYGKGMCEYELGLEAACESLVGAVKIKKGQLLEKALTLNELGCYLQAAETFEFLLENHFAQDEMYVRALNGIELARARLDAD